MPLVRVHFHNWIDDKEVALSIELLEWGRTFRDFGGNNIPEMRNFEMVSLYYII